jgi:ribonuclease G
MSGIEILCFSSPGETRLLARDDAGPMAICVERPGAPALSGSICLGRVARLAKNIGAAFIDLGLERQGFLPHADCLEGEALLVQIQAEPVEDKGPRLTSSPVLSGGLLIYTPSRPGLSCSRKMGEGREALKTTLAPLLHEGEGVIIRSSALAAHPDELIAELAWLRGNWAAIVTKAASDSPPAAIFAHENAAIPFLGEISGLAAIRVNDVDYLNRLRGLLPPGLANRLILDLKLEDEAIEAAIEAALSPIVPLPSGGSLYIETTRALIAIDVNSGSNKNPDAQAAANLEAATEIPRQLRLRNLAGRVLVDFIAGGRAKPEAALAKLKSKLTSDSTPTHLLGASPSGLVELVRERRGASLSSLLCQDPGEPSLSPESLALAALRQAVKIARQGGPPRLKLLAAPIIIDALKQDLAEALAATEAKLGAALVLVGEENRQLSNWEIVGR